MIKEYLTIKEISDFTGITPSKIHNYLITNKIPKIKNQNKVFIESKYLEEIKNKKTISPSGVSEALLKKQRQIDPNKEYSLEELSRMTGIAKEKICRWRLYHEGKSNER